MVYRHLSSLNIATNTFYDCVVKINLSVQFELSIGIICILDSFWFLPIPPFYCDQPQNTNCFTDFIVYCISKCSETNSETSFFLPVSS